MATRQRLGDQGAEDARRLVQRSGREIREARLLLGLSQEFVARAAGMSASQLGRLERGEIRRPTVEQVCRAARAVGLESSLAHHPSGVRIRDKGQLALLADLEVVLAPPQRLRREVPLPIAGDRRAWDGAIDDGSGFAFVEGEARIGDAQAMSRRIELKLRDDPRGRVVIVVVRRSAHNRSVLAAHREALRIQLPLDGAAILRALRAGRLPGASGILAL
jgi:transcriptional regulator with XRE-family HTH domain